jgi:MoxR-like ATPase
VLTRLTRTRRTGTKPDRRLAGLAAATPTKVPCIDRVTGRQRAVRARVLTEALGMDASMLPAQL